MADISALWGLRDKMGLSITEIGAFGASVATNPNVGKLMDGAAATGAPDPRYDGFLHALGDKYKANPNVIDQMNTDLGKDPTLGPRLEKIIKTNPGAAAKDIAAYQPGSLAAMVTAAEVRQSPQVAAAPAPAAQKVSTQQQPASAPQAAAAPKPYAEPADSRPRATAVPPAEKRSEPIQAAVAIPAAAAPAMSRAEETQLKADLNRRVLTQLSTADDAKIGELMTDKKFVANLTAGLAEFGRTTYADGVGHDADKLDAAVKARPELLDKIGDNFARNPGVVRDLAKMALDDSADMKTGMKASAVQNTLKEMYNDPDNTLASDKYMKGLGTSMKQGNDMLGGISSWFKNTLGLDLGGMMKGLGHMLEGMMKWVGNFFKQFSGGNFALMGNVEPGRSLFGKLGASMDAASNFSARETQLLGYADLKAKPGAQGPVNDGFEYDGKGQKKTADIVKADGSTVKEPIYHKETDHTLSVTLANGSQKQIFLTDGLNPSHERNGSYTWTVATEFDPQTKRPVSLTEINLSRTESDRLYSELRKAGGGQKIHYDPSGQTQAQPQVPQVSAGQERNIIRVSTANGQTSVEPAFVPTGPSSPIAPPSRVATPGGAAANAPEIVQTGT